MSKEGAGALLDAVKSGNVERVRAVLEMGGSDALKARAPDGSTPLIFAAFYIFLNMFADILAIIANPRLRHPR